ncbi:hypothetical protein PSAC2689_50480 [Paraburkholderia sacchari]
MSEGMNRHDEQQNWLIRRLRMVRTGSEPNSQETINRLCALLSTSGRRVAHGSPPGWISLPWKPVWRV